MPPTRLRILTSALIFGLGLAASCAPAGPPAAAPSAVGLGGSGLRTARKARPPLPKRPPPPTITTAMAGEPTGAGLSEARLVASSCEKASVGQVEVRVKEMRVAVDAAFREWHDGQPDCWAQDRAEYLERKQMELEDSDSSSSFNSYAPRPMRPTAEAPTASAMDKALSAGDPSARASAGASPRKSAAPEAARSASGTNNQVASVDEADIVKNDGRYVYLAANGALRIVEALKPKMVSITKLPGTAREMFVEGDRAVVYTANGTPGTRCTYGYDCAFGGDATSTTISVFDISNRAEPKLVRQMDLSGSLIAARRIGGAVHTVVSDGDVQTPPYETWPADFEMCGTMEPAVRAKFAKLKADNERAIRATAKTASFPTMRDQGAAQPLCKGLLRTAIRDGQAFTTLVSFDMREDRAPATTATVQSRPGAVFASADALYLSVVHERKNSGTHWYPSYAAVDEASEIHKFRIGTSPRETRYLGSGVVPGHVLSQFAMDEWYGYLRVATSRGRVPDPNVESAVSILASTKDGNLVRVGAVDKIAPGEDIRAVRFDDDRGYVVTFRKTDPLFVLDLYQPARPTILGELKIPGFSTYLHRIDEQHLLSIGFDGNDADGVALQLFDVKNPTDPRLVHKEKIGSHGSSSQAATDHLAFNYVASEGLLAIPMTICDATSNGGNGDNLAFSGLLVYDVDVEKGFTRLGGVDHGTKGVSCNTQWSAATSAVKRSVFLDDLVYSIATDRMKVQRMTHLGSDLADFSLTQ